MPANLPQTKPIARVLLRILFRVQVVGRLGPVHLSGRVLIIANHESFLDGVILALFPPRRSGVFIVHTYVAENRWFRLGLCLVDYLTLDPTSPLGMRQVVRLLESGRPSPGCGPSSTSGPRTRSSTPFGIPFRRSDHRGALAAGDRDPHLHLSEPATLPRDPGAGL